jgi:putative iron-dependent peroxidase
MKSAPILSKQLDDIQGMLRSGYGWLKTSRFWLLTIRDGREDEARAWLATLLKKELIVSAKRVGKAKDDPVTEAVAIAFSYSGLTKLGCVETGAHPFPTPFQSGMGSKLRAALLNDNPREWRWTDVEDGADRQTVHILVAQWLTRDVTPKMPDPPPGVFTIGMVDNHKNSFRKPEGEAEEKLHEPFGFRDGLAQPVIRGLRDAGGETPRQAKHHAGALYDDRVVEPGEFILGYRNEYDELTYCPNVERWAQLGQAPHPGGRFTLNGSYLAVRQIEQNVEKFKALETASGVSACEKMMGRYKNGLPLSWKGNPKANNVPDSTADAFRYQVEDANGFMCPKGAHIRRMNPRDSLGVDVQAGIKSSKLHRLLRRGRPYLEAAVNAGEPPREGIFFIACNADLERQFEFMHQRWMRNFRFGDLHHEDDPIVGTPIVGSPPPSKTFTIPGLPSGDQMSLEALTETMGGGYFFLPGIKALKFVVEHSAHPARSDAGPVAAVADAH